MTLGPVIAGTAWSSYWNLMRRYHRFEVHGLEHLDPDRSSLIVGYHGRAMAHDMCMLMEHMREQRMRIRAVMHRTAALIPGINWMVEGLGFVTGDGEDTEAALARGESLMVTPGGSMEGCRSFRDRYTVRWGNRYGYLRLALKYKLPIIPTAGTGVDDTFIGLNDGYALGKRLRLPGSLPLWLAFGMTGPWPFTLPFPVKITCHIGEPIHLGDVDPGDRSALERLHVRVSSAVQGLLEEARGRQPIPKQGALPA
ncbi:MAG: lysophospholipid acyltransferase family protein [Hyalangium sp.]|uniref:lysophospholipid acyltransferase family protein n=1 Tax=Hyalangium sp. TaxID=2028555 RepID=UPI003899D045